jgi:HNH endonuclease/Bifunctional DNA primase/polymerase, N-terminal
MAKVRDPNPHLSYLDGDGQVKEQIAAQMRRAFEMADRHKEAPPLSEEQRERERFQFLSNTMAEANPLYAAARAASAFLVLPLEPGGTSPLVEPSKATRDPRVLFQWWQEWPSVNPGVLLGRRGGIFAIRVEDNKAAEQIVAIGSEPRSTQRTSIPDDVKHLVWIRDNGRCRRCGSANELQFDHIIPLALGGGDSAENVQVLCGPCNRLKSAGLTVD